MKQVFESDLVGFDESARKVYIYELNDGEFDEYEEMTHDELCDSFGFVDDSLYPVMPGGKYHAYSFDIDRSFIVAWETVAYNV